MCLGPLCEILSLRSKYSLVAQRKRFSYPMGNFMVAKCYYLPNVSEEASIVGSPSLDNGGTRSLHLINVRACLTKFSRAFRTGTALMEKERS